jgi:hypothetical protein
MKLYGYDHPNCRTCGVLLIPPFEDKRQYTVTDDPGVKSSRMITVPRVYCSEPCERKYQRFGPVMNGIIPEFHDWPDCRNCGTDIIERRSDAIYCGLGCKNEWFQKMMLLGERLVANEMLFDGKYWKRFR